MGDLEAYKKKQADGGNGIKVQKIGIYFDDPNIIEDPSLARASTGFLIPHGSN